MVQTLESGDTKIQVVRVSVHNFNNSLHGPFLFHSGLYFWVHVACEVGQNTDSQVNDIQLFVVNSHTSNDTLDSTRFYNRFDCFCAVRQVTEGAEGADDKVKRMKVVENSFNNCVGTTSFADFVFVVVVLVTQIAQHANGTFEKIFHLVVSSHRSQEMLNSAASHNKTAVDLVFVRKVCQSISAVLNQSLVLGVGLHNHQNELDASFNADLIFEFVGQGHIGQQIHTVFQKLLVLEVAPHGSNQLTKVGDLSQESSNVIVVARHSQ
mmetsp:Transcript_8935/g.17079  ORF Transcript_8935/g.17079 Transcript_8935/m.17079 type:complete len:266 (-) Transcript_8935:1356-2153(-)